MLLCLNTSFFINKNPLIVLHFKISLSAKILRRQLEGKIKTLWKLAGTSVNLLSLMEFTFWVTTKVIYFANTVALFLSKVRGKHIIFLYYWTLSFFKEIRMPCFNTSTNVIRWNAKYFNVGWQKWFNWVKC